MVKRAQLEALAMKKPLIILAMTTILAIPSAYSDDALPFTQADVDLAKLLRDDALSGTRAWNIVESLTTEVGPRLAGSEAEARARNWAVETLTGYGFENVRVEPFMIEGWRRGEEVAEVVSPFPQKLAITSLGNSVATSQTGVEADVVLFDSLSSLKAVADGALDGKIAYVGHGMQRTQDGSSYGHFVRLRSAAAIEAGRKGAAAVLIRSIGTDSHRMPHTGNMTYAGDVTPIPIAALSNPDADQIERIAARGEPLRVKLTLTPSYTGAVQSGNVVAELPGTDLADEFVVIGGHLDSCDLGTGAIDDGAGVGITIEVLRRIKEAGLKPRRTIRLVLWGAEEVGLLGGYAYAEKHKENLRKHVIGTESDFGAGRIWKITRSINEDARPVADMIAQLVEPLGIVPGSTDSRSSGPDLTPLNKLGFPGFRFVQDGSDYFDLHHTPDDTLDKIDPAAMDQNVAAYLVFVWMAANSDVSDWGWLNDQPG
jgi:hypothetical protein